MFKWSVGNSTIMFRLILNIMLFVFITAVLLTLFNTWIEYKKNIENIHIQLDQIEQSFLNSLSNSVWLLNEDLIYSQLRGLKALPFIDYVKIKTDDDFVFLAGVRPDESQFLVKRVYHLQYTAEDATYEIGTLLVIANLEPIKSALFIDFRNTFLSVALEILLLAFFLYFVVYRLIFRHLNDLNNFMLTAGWNNIEEEFVLNRKASSKNKNDELTVLVNSFNSLRKQLKSKHDEVVQSESRYLELSEASIQGIWIHVQHRPVYINKAALEIFHLDSKETFMEKDSILDFIHPDEHERILKYLKARNTDEPCPSLYEFKALTSNGDEILLLNSVSKVDWEGQDATLSTFIDITKRKKAEKELKLSEEKFSKAFLSGPEILFITRLENGQIIDANLAFSRFTGWSAEEALGATTTDLAILPSELRDQLISNLTANKHIRNIEIEYKTKDKQTRYALCSAELIDINNETCIITIARDITDFRATRDALLESESRLKQAQGMARLGHWSLIPGQDQLECSEWVYRNFGFEPYTHPTTIKNFIKATHPDDKQQVVKILKGEIDNEIGNDIRVYYPDGSLHWIMTTGKKECDDEGKLIRLYGIVQDITDRKLAEKEIMESRERLRNLVNGIEEVRENERIGIAREIHDELGQTLTGIKIDLGRMNEQLEDSTINSEIDSLMKNIDQAVEVVRKISSSLRPPILDDLGLLAAIEWVANGFSERTGINVDLDFNCDDLVTETVRDTALFRIFQEAMTNIARHSRANNVLIRVRTDTTGLELTIEDDGIGIPSHIIDDNKSIGIIGMDERATHIGAQLGFEKRLQGGTRVKLVLEKFKH